MCLCQKFYLHDNNMNNKKYIPRPLYLNKIEPFIGSKLIKVLTGQRRVGKRYVLLRVMDEIRKRDPKAIIISVQVAYLIADEKTHEREFENLLSIPDNCKKLVVSMDGYVPYSATGYA